MIKRWIIRGLFLLLPVMCGVGWAWSLTHWGVVSGRHNGLQISGQTHSGEVVVQVVRFKPPCADAWSGRAEPREYTGFWPTSIRGPKTSPGYHLPGGLGWNQFPTGATMPGAVTEICELYIPYWVWMLLFFVALLVAWRKTRPKGTGFPVEPARKIETK